MARVCAERGTLQLDGSFLNQLPFCTDCGFDLVHTSRAFHEFAEASDIESALQNFDKALSCGGMIVIEDGNRPKPEIQWTDVAAAWAQKRGYAYFSPEEGQDGRAWITKMCPPASSDEAETPPLALNLAATRSKAVGNDMELELAIDVEFLQEYL